MTTRFNSIGEIFVELSSLLKPPEDLTVSEAAEKYRYVNSPGSYVGPWLNSTVWYLVEPMNVTISPDYKGCIFVAPAQAGKTDALIINRIVYSVKINPMDMMIVCPTNVAARDFSIRRIDRLHDHSKEVGAMMLNRSDSDNTFDKSYTNGMLLTLSWPTPIELAGKPVPVVLLTDRDRMPDDVDGDGDPHDLASKRTTTFGSYAMTVSESSPSRPVKDMKWIPKTPHEAPPCDGIIGLYNRGDRRRWYWPCQTCGTYFEALFDHLEWDTDLRGSNYEKSLTVRMRCPANGCFIDPADRAEMQFWGVWVKDGQGVDNHGRIIGPEPKNQIASFWLRGVAASFVKWHQLVNAYLDANDHYLNTGSEDALKKFYNNDLGEPYYPKSVLEARLPEDLKGRAEHSTGKERTVPANVRFLIATVDVQQSKFVVEVHGILPGAPFDTFLVDRFDIQRSKRRNEHDEALWVKPATYLEDWDELIEHVIQKTYPLDDDSGRVMHIKYTGCDSGGKRGATTMAYNFYRSLKERNLHRRFILIKGDHSPNQPRARISYPDSSRKDVKAGARGDIPVLLLNSNMVKDNLDGRLDSIEPGKGMYRTPDWLSDEFYNELCAEVRGPKGWTNDAGHRNEAWDLAYYCIGLCISELLRVEQINWSNPPSWAAEWDRNDLVRMPAKDGFASDLESSYDFAQLGRALA